jgi:hypothetical protein
MKKVLWLAVALLLMGWSQAFADYTFTYSDSVDTSLGVVTGYLDTASNGAGPLTVTGGYLVTGGITYNLLPGAGSNSPNGAFYWDNQLSPGQTPMLTGNGLVFTTTTGPTEINIFGNTGAHDYGYWVGTAFNTFSVGDMNGTFLISAVPAAVPVPPSVLLLASGLFGLVGLGRLFKHAPPRPVENRPNGHGNARFSSAPFFPIRQDI